MAAASKKKNGKGFDAGLSNDECWEKMKAGCAFDRYDEVVMNWRMPNGTELCRARLDPTCSMLILENPSDDASIPAVLPIEYMSDIRDVAFTDESEETLLKPEDYNRLICIAHYNSWERDYVNVLLTNLVAADETTAMIWKQGLQSLVDNNSMNSPRFVCTAERIRLLHAQVAAHAVGNAVPLSRMAAALGKDSLEACITFLDRKGVQLITKSAFGSEQFIPAGQFTVALFEDLFYEIIAAPSMDVLFERQFPTAAKRGYLALEDLETFLQQTQRDPRANEILDPMVPAREILKRFETDETLLAQNRMSIRSLFRYLASKDNDFVDSKSRRVSSKDMELPLAAYFVSSSHNTYLTGGQLQSKSTVEIYRQVLMDGCRCVEVDIWDGANGEPEVTHGKTLCTKIECDKVIQAIAEYSFVYNEWPVILSFENHTSPAQMRKLAAMCKKHFGSLLQNEFLPGDGYDTLPNKLPSPAKLKNKLLIKNKRQKQKHQHGSLSESESGLSMTSSTETSSAVAQATTTPAEVDDVDIVIGDEVLHEDEDEIKHRRERTGEIVKEMSDLVNYITPFHFAGFEVAARNNNCYHISSFSERRGLSLLTRSAPDFVDHHKMQLSRVYPNGSRVSSSNYNPQAFWNAGFQLVALNWQTNSMPMQLNTGRFLENGRSGYVPKPTVYVDPAKSFDPFSQSSIPDSVAISLSVSVVGLIGVHRKDAAPVVDLQVYGLPSDSKGTKFRTRACRGKGLSPFWTSDNELHLERILMPQMALLRISCTDVRDQTLFGNVVIPASTLRNGCHFIPLRNARFPWATLLVKFSVSIYVPALHSDIHDRLVNPTKYSRPWERNLEEMKELIEEDEGQAKERSVVQQGEVIGGDRPSSARTPTGGINTDLLGFPSMERQDSDVSDSQLSTASSSAANVHLTLEDTLDKMKRRLKEYIVSEHRVKTKYILSGKCALSGKRVRGSKVPVCVQCNMIFATEAEERTTLPECPANKYRAGADESPKVLQLKTKHQRQLKSATSKMDDQIEAALGRFETGVRAVFKQYAPAIKKYRSKMKKKGASVDAETAGRLNEALREGHQSLIGLEKDLVQDIHGIRQEHLQDVIHPLRQQQQEELREVQQSELEVYQSKDERRLTKELHHAGIEVIAFVSNSTAKNQQLISEYNRKVVTASVEVKKELRRNHEKEKAQQADRLVAQERQLDEELSRQIQELHDDLKSKLANLDKLDDSFRTDKAEWADLTATSYILALRDARRI